MATVFKLIIEDDEGKTTVVPLSRGELSIGRMEGNTIRLMERNVSRRHARLVRENGAVLIEDLNSFNGVKINGERIESRIEVKEGDLVEIGDYHLALQREDMLEGEAEQRPAPARTEALETIPDVRAMSADAANRETVEQRRPELPTIQSGPPTEKRSGLPPFPSSGIAGPGALSSATVPDQPSPEALRSAATARTEPISVLQAVADHPRIICVTTEHAGREFALNRPEVVIGRVEDNDVVIEHRSVSRNHAKIVFDGRVHKIIDLESANGILVNGEEYAITDLRRNDLIELGHVCFRYLPAGEAFEPTAEEARAMLDAGVTPPKSRHGSAPKAPQVATDLARARDAVALDDPSNAQTVTDTPLSALDEPKATPVVASVPSTRPAQVRPSNPPTPEQKHSEPRHDPKHVEPRHDAKRAEPKHSEPKHSEPKHAEVKRSAPAPAPKAREEAPRTQPDPPKKSPMAFVAAGVALLLTAGIAIFAFGGRKSAEHDQFLEKLYQDGQHAQVVDYYEKHISDFKDSPAAYLRVKESLVALKNAEPPKKEEPPPQDPAPDQLAPNPPVPDPPEPDPSGADTDDAKAKRKAAAAKKKSNFPRAMELEKEGTRLLVEGKLDQAERLFVRCLEMAEHPPCHRQLGIIYAQQDRTKQSIEHYEKYVELSPNAKDATQVRELIKRSKGQD
ncbi:MAG: FHA domain-containing protein [Deltaproteobacteria bacterium]|nr:FHA domain-containing protein [Deltaproteobacteria bacterium]